MTARDEIVELPDELLQGIVPRDCGELTGAPTAGSFQRLPDAIRMIGDLNRRLAARAQLALVDWMRRIAFQLLRQTHPDQTDLSLPDHFRITLHDTDQQPATCVTERTHTRLPF